MYEPACVSKSAGPSEVIIATEAPRCDVLDERCRREVLEREIDAATHLIAKDLVARLGD